MITSGIIIAVNNLLQSIISLFPEADSVVVASIGSNVSNFVTFMTSISYIFPLSTFFVILSLIMVIEHSYAIYQTFMWVIKRLPFVGG